MYEFRCDECGHTFDAFQRMSEDPLTECPKCGLIFADYIEHFGLAEDGHESSTP